MIRKFSEFASVEYSITEFVRLKIVFVKLTMGCLIGLFVCLHFVVLFFHKKKLFLFHQTAKLS